VDIRKIPSVNDIEEQTAAAPQLDPKI